MKAPHVRMGVKLWIGFLLHGFKIEHDQAFKMGITRRALASATRARVP
jgi:hypothetical protein